MSAIETRLIAKDLAVATDRSGRIVATCVLHGGLTFTPGSLAQLAAVAAVASAAPKIARVVVASGVRVGKSEVLRAD